MTVIIPSAAWDDEARVAARRWVTGWWLARGCDVVTPQLAERPWRKGAAVNDAIRAATGDVVVVADADSFVAERAVERMIRKVLAGAWVAPFTSVRRLDKAATAEVLALSPATVDRPPVRTLAQKPHAVLPGGGIIAAHRDVWAEVGGFDPRFADWGGEDYSLGCAMRTVTGQACTTITGDLWHLWHRPQNNVRQESRETSALAFRYRRAKFRPDDMRQLLAEWR